MIHIFLGFLKDPPKVQVREYTKYVLQYNFRALYESVLSRNTINFVIFIILNIFNDYRDQKSCKNIKRLIFMKRCIRKMFILF